MTVRHRRWLFWGPTILALALRVVHVLAMSDNPLFEHPMMDARMHDLWARGLLAGTWPGSEPFFRAPLYPYLLGGLYALFDAQRLPVQLVHALISALGAGWAALAAADLWGRRAGWAAGLLYATLWTGIYFSAELLIVSVPVTLDLLALSLLVGGPVSGRRAAAAGVVLGLSAIARPNILVVVPAVLWFLAGDTAGRRRWRVWACLLVGAAVPVLPVTLHNTIRGDDAVLIASQGGVNFYIGNNPESDGRTAIVPGTRPTWDGGYEDAVAMAEKAAGRELAPSEVDRYFVRRGLEFWRDEPGAAMDLFGRKLRLLIGAGERSNNKFIYAWREWSPLLQAPVLAGWPLMLALGILGLGRAAARRRGRGLVLGMAAAYAVTLLLFFVNARFRLPVAALLTVPAGAGVDALITAVRTRSFPRPGRMAVLAVLVLAISLADLFDFHERRIEDNPFYAFTLGNAYAATEETGEAIAAYRRALEIQSRRPQANFELIGDNLHRSLAVLLSAEGRHNEAATVVRSWVRAVPESREARLWLGNLFLDLGRVDEASAQFEFVLRVEPTDPEALLGRAWIYYHNGDLGAALRRFQQLARKEEGVQAAFGAGLCQTGLQRWAEAERTFRALVQKDRDHWRAWGNLAQLHDRAGRRDAARAAYRELLRIRPDDAGARAWLATDAAQGR